GTGLAQCWRWETAGRDRKVSHRADDEGGIVGAGDGRGLVHRQGESLRGGTADAVAGRDGEGVRSRGSRGRRAAEHAGGGERDAGWQGARLAEGRRWGTGGGDRETACRTDRECGVIGTGD